jgi:hypothetical protein
LFRTTFNNQQGLGTNLTTFKKLRIKRKMADIEILKQFKLSIISFLDECIEQFSPILDMKTKANLVIFRIFLKDQIDINTVMDQFIKNIFPYRPMIKQRDEDFFLNHCSLMDPSTYAPTNKEHVNYFKKIWMSEKVDEDDKKAIWEWFDMFVILSEKYQKFRQ